MKENEVAFMSWLLELHNWRKGIVGWKINGMQRVS